MIGEESTGDGEVQEGSGGGGDTTLSDVLHSSARPRKQGTFALKKQTPCKGQGNTKTELTRQSPFNEVDFQKKLNSPYVTILCVYCLRFFLIEATAYLNPMLHLFAAFGQQSDTLGGIQSTPTSTTAVSASAMSVTVFTVTFATCPQRNGTARAPEEARDPTSKVPQKGCAAVVHRGHHREIPGR